MSVKHSLLTFFLALFMINGYADQELDFFTLVDTNNVSAEDRTLIRDSKRSFYTATSDSIKLDVLQELVINLLDVEAVEIYGLESIKFADQLLKTANPKNRRYILEYKSMYVSFYSWTLGLKGMTDAAMEQEFTGLRIGEELGDSNMIGRSYTGIAVLYQHRKELQKSIDYLYLAMDYLATSKDLDNLCYAACSLGGLLYETEQYDTAKVWLIKSIDYAEALNDQVLVARSELFLAKIYGHEGNFSKAIEYNLLVIEKLEKEKHFNLLPDACNNASSHYYDMGDFKKAEEYALKSIAYNKNKSQHSFKSSYLYLSGAQQKLGKYQEALESHIKYTEISDSLRQIVSEKKLAEQEVKYSYQKKAIADSLESAAEIQISQLQVEKKNRETRFLWIGIGSFLILIFILFRAYNTNKKQKDQLAIERAKLDRSNSQLKEMDKMKSDFFTNVSHEFRTPLTVISGMAGQIVKDPNKNAIEGGKMIQKSSVELLNLVEQILELRKLETGNVTLNYKEGNLSEYINNLVNSIQSFAEEQNVSLSFETTEEAIITAFDKSKIQSIVVNLLANAIKYNQDNGMVKCSLSSTPSTFNIRIEDNGIGMSPEDQTKVFERFYRVDQSETREREGTGVGLALVKELVELMHGTIDLTSKTGEGTSVNITLPITHAEQQHEKSSVSTDEVEEIQEVETLTPELDSDIENLLIVEDNQQIREYLKTLLGNRYKLTFANNGDEGIQKAIETVPDIILSDVMMPRVSGFELVETLKEDERTNHIPIVLLTAKADVDSKLSGLKKGADAYLAKPFNEEELSLILKNLIDQRNRIQEKYQVATLPEPIDEPTEEDKFIVKIQELLSDQQDNSEYGIPELCKDLGMSRTQLHNKLKAISGLSTSHYIRQYKVEQAKLLLTEGKLNASEIAYSLGFKSPSYFSTVFSKVTGVTPKQYQNNT